jgi:hypothetical protein
MLPFPTQRDVVRVTITNGNTIQINWSYIVIHIRLHAIHTTYYGYVTTFLPPFHNFAGPAQQAAVSRCAE